jgi:putative ABC transport system permease protein
MFLLAFHNIFRHKARTFLTLLVIVFGVVGLILTGGFIEDVFIQLQEVTIHSQLGHLQLYRAGYSERGRRNPYQYMIDDPSQVTDRIIDLPHVSDVLLRVNFSGLANNGRGDLNIIGEGVQPDKEARLGTVMTITSGRQLTAADTHGIVVGQGVARALQLKQGDYLTLLVSTTDGALNSLESEVLGIFQTFSRDYDNRAVRIPLAAAQDLVGTAGVHRVVVSLDATELTDTVAERIKRVFSSSEYEIKPWYEIADFYRKAVDLYRSQFAVLQFIILLMVLLSVANSVNMAVYERVGEFGTLMALGDKQGDIFRLVLKENMLLGLLGAGLGVVFGVIFAWSISGIGIEMPPPPNSDLGYTASIRIVPRVIAMAFGVGAVATLLAALLPAYRVASLPVADALRKNV